MRKIKIFIVLAIVGIVTTLAVPSLLNAFERRAQKRTMGDMRSVSTAMEMYSIDQHAYPAVASIDELVPLLQPSYIKELPLDDGWGNRFACVSDGLSYALASRGGDGRFAAAGLLRRPNGGFTHVRRGDVLRQWVTRKHSMNRPR